ncbi:MAG: lamin tail domain-containing protein [Candidatus Promineifilaceae bacterium]
MRVLPGRTGWIFISLAAATLALAAGSRAALGRSPVGSLVISEVAWAGTQASGTDHWLELYNRSAAPVDLDGWSLFVDATLVVSLTGILQEQDFYLLERFSDQTVSDVPADQLFLTALPYLGGTLALRDADGALVDSANGDGGPWPAGTAEPHFFSMERSRPDADDLDANWLDNNGFIRNGHDANGDPLNGTPKQPNSHWTDPLPQANILIDGLYYDAHESNEPDEALRLLNLTEEAAAVGGWRISDGVTEAVFPPGATLPPAGHLWLARDAAAFRRQFGFAPNFEAVDADPAVPNLSGAWPGFANVGDEALLLNFDGGVADALVYAAGNVQQSGWSGPALQPYSLSGVFGLEGRVLYRRRDPLTGRPVPDSNQAVDWAAHSGDPFTSRKVAYPGWEPDGFFFTRKVTETASLTLATAPDNAYEAIAAEIAAAQSSILAASHSFTSIALAEGLAAAAGRGVQVVILLEGAPPGAIHDQEKLACQILEASAGQCWFMINAPELEIFDRYPQMHASYLMIDGQRTILGSSSLGPESLPNDDKSDGTWGRRGIFAITGAAGVVAHLTSIWERDFDPVNQRDLFRWSAEHPTYGAPPPGTQPITVTGGVTYPVHYPLPLTYSAEFPFEMVQSPENSLHPRAGLLGLIGRAGAGDTLLVQQLSEPSHWGEPDSTPEADPNPRLEALLEAAGRGASVRILLDDYFDDPAAAMSNAATCGRVNEIAAAGRLDLACVLGDPAGLGLDNKMLLAEIGGIGYVHVGSLSGAEAASKANRELALQIESNDLYAVLSGLFESDWPWRQYLPVFWRD